MRVPRLLPVAVKAGERYGLGVADRTYAGQEWSAARGRLAQARAALHSLFRLTDRGGWVAPGVLACAYPRTERALATLSGRGVRLLINLHERPHDQARLRRHGLREVHLPVRDFTAPSLGQIECGVDTIFGTLAAGEAAAVHCGGGLGRTGTLLACYLASSEGLGAAEAIRRVRALRPGSVETLAQAAAVDAWTRRSGQTRT